MRQLTLTNKQFEVLYDIVADTVDYIEDDLITTEDENGNEVLEDISEYEVYQIYQQLVSLKDDAKVTITPQQLEGDISTVTDKVYPQVDDVPDNIKKEWLYNYTHDSERC